MTINGRSGAKSGDHTHDDPQSGPNVHPRALYIVTKSDAFIII
jgi:hypothetical protein